MYACTVHPRLCVGVSRETLHFGRSKHSFLLTRFCPRVDLQDGLSRVSRSLEEGLAHPCACLRQLRIKELKGWKTKFNHWLSLWPWTHCLLQVRAPSSFQTPAENIFPHPVQKKGPHQCLFSGLLGYRSICSVSSLQSVSIPKDTAQENKVHLRSTCESRPSELCCGVWGHSIPENSAFSECFICPTLAFEFLLMSLSR